MPRDELLRAVRAALRKRYPKAPLNEIRQRAEDAVRAWGMQGLVARIVAAHREEEIERQMDEFWRHNTP